MMQCLQLQEDMNHMKMVYIYLYIFHFCAQEIIRRTDYHFTALRERLDELDKESSHPPGDSMERRQGLESSRPCDLQGSQEVCESAGPTAPLDIVLETVQEEDSIPEATGLEQPRKSESKPMLETPRQKEEERKEAEKGEKGPMNMLKDARASRGFMGAWDRAAHGHSTEEAAKETSKSHMQVQTAVSSALQANRFYFFQFIYTSI